MAIDIFIKATDSPGQITGKILRGVALRLTSTFHASATAIRTRIGGVIDTLIQGTDEYKSLLSGELLAELGVPEIDARLKAILNILKNDVQVGVVPCKVVGQNITGGMNIGILKSGFEAILSSSESTYISNQYVIPWLDWLIAQGDRIIVLDYEINYRLTPAQRIASRSGKALMFPGDKGWRVPPQYSGTIDDNFITKAFRGEDVKRLLARIVEEEITKRVG